MSGCTRTPPPVAFPIVTPQRDLSWLKDGRVRATAVGCVLVGFLIGMVLFGTPWHLRPNWGDLPTWFAAAFAAIAGWVALGQLRILREQVASEAERNAKRDELLDTQLAEAQARAVSGRRSQAEEVETAYAPRNTAPYLWVINDSSRPISDITAKIVIKATGEVIATAQTFAPGRRQGDAGWLVGAAVKESNVSALRADMRVCLYFGKVTLPPDHIAVAWFTDDTGTRWQLDALQHLVETVGDNYVP